MSVIGEYDECEHGIPLCADCPDCLKRQHADELRALDAQLTEVEAERDRLRAVAQAASALWDYTSGTGGVCHDSGQVDALAGALNALDEGDVPPSTAVAWCPDCGEIETCDEDGACSCGRDIVVFADQHSYEMALEHVAAVTDERDRLHEALARWGRWCHSPDGMDGQLFMAAVEGIPADCFPEEDADHG